MPTHKEKVVAREMTLDTTPACFISCRKHFMSQVKKKNGIMEQLVSFAVTVREQNFIVAVFLERLELGRRQIYRWTGYLARPDIRPPDG